MRIEKKFDEFKLKKQKLKDNKSKISVSREKEKQQLIIMFEKFYKKISL